jgi:hypothetical protein
LLRFIQLYKLLRKPAIEEEEDDDDEEDDDEKLYSLQYHHQLLLVLMEHEKCESVIFALTWKTRCLPRLAICRTTLK